MAIKNSVFFDKINNKNIFCYLSTPEKNNKKIIIMSHGFRGSTLGPARNFVDLTRILNKAGYSTLRFDHANSGNSEGEYIESSFDEWVKTIKQFVKKYINLNYKVSVLGQSMGATATMIAVADKEIKDKVPCISLWVPDPEEDGNTDSNKIYEENGQKYKGAFFTQAKNADFFDCLNRYPGKINLVYGSKDRYVTKKLRNKVIKKVKEKSKLNRVMILDNQEHSPWEYDIAQKVYSDELDFLNKYL